MMRWTPILATAMALAACGEGGEGVAATPAATGGEAAGQTTAAASGPAVTPETRTFRDWIAVCDNGLDCAAFTGGDQGWIKVSIPAGPQGEAVVTTGAFLTEDVPQMTVVTDAGRFAVRPEGRAGRVAGEATGRALAALASTRALSVNFGSESATLSPAGASAALLWIDEKQGRLGTTTALIRRGERPASSVPAAPALPRIQAAAGVDQGPLGGANDPGEQGDTAGVRLPPGLEALAEVRQCREETGDNEYLSRAILAGPLSGDRELWGVPCAAGAYNITYAIYVSGPNGANPVKTELRSWDNAPCEEGDIAGDGLVNPTFDAAAGTISHFPRGRGLGDCGVIQTWVWTGARFALTEEKVMGECWGIPSAEWPTTWRTR